MKNISTGIYQWSVADVSTGPENRPPFWDRVLALNTAKIEHELKHLAH